MKKVIPYLLALILGYLIANLIFDYQNIKMTGFQLGVYKDVTLAKEYNKKYTRLQYGLLRFFSYE